VELAKEKRMEDDSRRFDEDATTLNLAEELDFDELDEVDFELAEMLCARVRAARCVA
jgi:hypothetical protein